MNFRFSIGRWSFSARFGRCGFGHRKCGGFFSGCPAGSIALGFVVITYLRRFIIPILFKRAVHVPRTWEEVHAAVTRTPIGGTQITRDEATRGLPSDAECEATRAEFKLKRKPHWVIPMFFKKK